MQQNTLHNNFAPATPRRAPSGNTIIRRAAPAITVLVVLALWQLVTALELYPSFIIPEPRSVLEKFVDVALDGRLWLHASTTLIEVVGGLFLGTVVGVTLGYLIAKNRLLEELLSPLIVALQSTPVVAYAPLLVIWFDTNSDNRLVSKILTCALIVFFPILMSAVVGVRNTPTPLRDLMRSLGASRWQTFAKLEVPAAMPVLLGGLKVGATLAVIGAVVGEFVSANAGLGFMMNLARNQYDTALVIVAVIALAFMARLLYGLVSLLEWRVLAWQRRVRREE